MCCKKIIEKIRKNLIPIISIIIVVVLIVCAIIFVDYSNSKIKLKFPSFSLQRQQLQKFSIQEVGDKIIKYINENILRGNATATLSEIKEESGLYKLKIKINNEEFPSYATLDGKFLFPDAINLEEKRDLTNSVENKEIPKTEKPDVKLFVMSFCPFGNDAENMIKPVVELLGDKINFEIHYIISKTSDNKYISLHGNQETNQDIREFCIFKYQKDKFWSFLEKINEKCSAQNADICWEEIAKESGIDINKIKGCEKSEINTILEQELKLVEEYKVSGSPQLFINGTDINKTKYGRQRTTNNYKDAICSGFNNPPSDCEKVLPETIPPITGGNEGGGCGK